MVVAVGTSWRSKAKRFVSIKKDSAGDVAAGPIQATNEAPANRIASIREDDWHCRGYGLSRKR